jgi:hypothetical protein
MFVAVGTVRRLERENASLRDRVDAGRIVVAFQLQPPGLRGEQPSETANRIHIPRDADGILLQFELADPPAGPLHTTLAPVDGGEERDLGPAAITDGSPTAIVSVNVRAGELLAGDYVLELRRGDTRRSPEREDVVARRSFRVTRE